MITELRKRAAERQSKQWLHVSFLQGLRLRLLPDGGASDAMFANYQTLKAISLQRNGGL